MTQTIKCGYGKVSFKNTGGSWLAAVVEAPSFLRKGVSQVFEKKNMTTRFPASAYPQINGYLHLDHFDLPDSTLILVQAQQRARGSPLREGALVIRVRAAGSPLAVLARMVPALESLLAENFLVFEGQGDILEEEEMEALGLRIPAFYRRTFFNPREVAECFTVAGLPVHKETARPVIASVEMQDGVVKKVLIAPAPARRIRITRPAQET